MALARAPTMVLQNDSQDEEKSAKKTALTATEKVLI